MTPPQSRSRALISSSSFFHTVTPSAHKCRKAHRLYASRVLRVLEGGDFLFPFYVLIALEAARRRVGRQEAGDGGRSDQPLGGC